MNQFPPSDNLPDVPESGSPLPMGDSKQGMTSNSLCGASVADLAGDKGYITGTGFDPDAASFTGDGLQDTDRKPNITAPPLNGFLDRPQGWQR